MGMMGPGQTLMAKCSCIEIFTGDGEGEAGASGAPPVGRDRCEEGLEGWKWECGGGGLDTLMVMYERETRRAWG